MQLRDLAYSFVEKRNDVEVWRFHGSKYSAAMVWNEIRPKMGKKEWHRLLWTSIIIPKHVIITWMTVLNRLPTMYRMIAWGLGVDGVCRLCQN